MSAPGEWSFGGELPYVFDSHARRSIPGYDELHATSLELVRASAPIARIFDLGCSTGALTRMLRRACEGATVVGVDGERGMVEEAARKDPSGTYVCSDLTRFELGSADAVFALYVLQFVPEASRLSVLTKIHRNLSASGFLVFAEKIRAASADEEARARSDYHAFKTAQGFTQEEILAKERSLRGILVPLTAAENERLLQDAGFTRVESIFTELCFRAWVARP